MLSKTAIQEQLKFPLDSLDVPALTNKYEGKVRDCFVVGNKRILVTTDRLSAFDVVLTTIPFKGQVLSQIASYWFDQTKDIIPNHLLDQPHPNVMVTREVKILPVEIIVRGYLAGSAWRDYTAGKAVSGIQLPKGMRKSERFPAPLITPSTKAERGKHDEPISSEEIVSSGLVDKALWDRVCDTALKLFARGTEIAAERGLILVDTKYEMGTIERPGQPPELVLADEVHTPDSSRYWISSSYQERFERGEDPDMLDKEFVRRWLIERGYMGEGTPPEFPDAFRVEIAERYMRLFEQVTGRDFSPKTGPIKPDVEKAVAAAAGVK